MAKKDLSRFTDDIPFFVVKPGTPLQSDINPDPDSTDYKEGVLARKAGEKRDIGKSLQWLLGWDHQDEKAR
jgi:hypothetical protein